MISYYKHAGLNSESLSNSFIEAPNSRIVAAVIDTTPDRLTILQQEVDTPTLAKDSSC